MLAQMKAAFMARGADAVTATERAYGALHGMLIQQASMVSFVWLFRLLGGIFLMLLPLILIMRRPKGRVAAAAH
jgi:DHA2 family multidrug resistance protein